MFRPKRVNQQRNSWSQQSGRTGGNIMEQNRVNNNGHNQRMNQQKEAMAVNDGYLDVQNRYVVPGFAPEVFN
jgi:hypothetical protein